MSALTLPALAHPRIREAIAFLAVGGTAFFVDFATFNILAASGVGVLTAKAVGIALSVAVAYIGSRYLTFAANRARKIARELARFVIANAVGGAIALACLGVSHYALGLTGTLADNVSGNIIGVALGTIARYFLYRLLVFPETVHGARR